MKAYLGTSGFSYAEWKGTFYPQKLANKDMLSFYATKLSSVEINNTFYRMPRRGVLEGWASQTSPAFRFAVKATRRITHFKKLRDPAELLGYFIGGLEALASQRGPVLFQLPPTMKADAALLAEFLSQVRSIEEEKKATEEAEPLLPAFEFRHPSWFSDEIYQVLEKGGAALVSGDLDDSDKDPPLVKTADFSYLRLRKTHYEESELDGWAEKLLALGVGQVFGYFKHEELGPQLAEDLTARLSGA